METSQQDQKQIEAVDELLDGFIEIPGDEWHLEKTH